MVASLAPTSPVVETADRSVRETVTLLETAKREVDARRLVRQFNIMVHRALGLVPELQTAIAQLWDELESGDTPFNEEAAGEAMLNGLTVSIDALEAFWGAICAIPRGPQLVPRADEIPVQIKTARALRQEFLDSWPSADDAAAAKRAAAYPLSNDKLLAFAGRQGPPPVWFEKDEDLFE